MLSGPSHILKEVDIVRQMKGKDAISKKIKSIAMTFIKKVAWSAHSEPLLSCNKAVYTAASVACGWAGAV